MRGHKFKIICGILFCTLLWPGLGSAGTYTMAPLKDNSEMRFSVNAGESTQGVMVVSNLSEEPITLLLGAVDNIHAFDSGAIVANKDSAEKRGAGLWTKFGDTPNISFAIEEKKEIPFTISIPSGTTPGTYSGSLTITKQAEESAATGTAGVTMNVRFAYPFSVIVPGEKVTDMEIGDLIFTDSPTSKDTLSFTVQNKGNTAIKVYVNIAIQDSFGIYSENIEKEFTMYTGDSLEQKYALPAEPFLGFFTAKANIKTHEYDIVADEMKFFKEYNISTDFYKLPVILLAVILVVLLVISLFFLRKH